MSRYRHPLLLALCLILAGSSASAQFNEIEWIREGRTRTTEAIAFSADGTLAAANENGTIRFWDVRDSRIKRIIHASDLPYLPPVALDYTSDFALITTGRLLLDPYTGEVVRSFSGHTGAFAALSPNDSLLASGSTGGVSIFEVATGREVFRVDERRIEKLGSTPWSPDGSSIALAAYPDTVLIYDVATRLVKQRLSQGRRVGVRSLAWVPGSNLVAAAAENSVMLWDVVTGDTVRSFTAANSIYSIAVSAAGTYIADAAGNGDGSVNVWRVATGELVMNVPAHDFSTNAVTFTDDETLLATAGSDGTIKIFEIPTGRLVRTFSEPASTGFEVGYDLDVTIDGDVAVGVATYNEGLQYGDLLVLNGMDGTSVSGFQTPEPHRPVFGVAVSRTSNSIAVATGGAVKILDGSTGAETQELDWAGAALGAYRVDFASYPEMVVSGGVPQWLQGAPPSRLFIWNATTGDTVRELGRGRIPVFLGDGAMVASAEDSGTIVLWDVATGLPIDTLPGHAPAQTLALYGSGNFLISGGSDSLVIVWNVSERSVYRRFTGHTGAVLSLAYDPTALASGGGTPDHLFSGGADGTVRVWSLGRDTLIHTFDEYPFPQVGLGLLPGGVASVTRNGAVIKWKWQTSSVPSSNPIERGHGIKLTGSLPNPAASSTTIGFRLEGASARELHLRIFDTRGELVKSIPAGIVAPGAGEIRVDTGSLPAGVYIYMIENGGSGAYGRMVVAR